MSVTDRHGVRVTAAAPPARRTTLVVRAGAPTAPLNPLDQPCALDLAALFVARLADLTAPTPEGAPA